MTEDYLPTIQLRIELACIVTLHARDYAYSLFRPVSNSLMTRSGMELGLRIILKELELKHDGEVQNSN